MVALYFDVLQKVLTSVEGWKIFEIREKFYFEDIGMRHAIVPFQQKDIGKVLENIVYHQLVINSYQFFVEKHSDKEINFVAIKENIKTYVQVAYLIADEKTHETSMIVKSQTRVIKTCASSISYLRK